jgi:hypothetical protein
MRRLAAYREEFRRRANCGFWRRIRRSKRRICLSIRRLKRKKGFKGTITLPAASSSRSITNQVCGALLVTSIRPPLSLFAQPLAIFVTPKPAI